jgi:CheY-like chemotaxis protein
MAAETAFRNAFNDALIQIARAAAACKESFSVVEASRRLRQRRESKKRAPLAICGSLGVDPAGESSSLARLVVLVVEDNEDTRAVIVELLRFYGARVVGVSTAFDALTYLQTHLPNVMITDLSMPGMDGIQLLDQIRRDTYTRRLPVIAITAFPADYVLRAQRSFNAFLRKPIDPDDLVKAIRAVTVEAL